MLPASILTSVTESNVVSCQFSVTYAVCSIA